MKGKILGLVLVVVLAMAAYAADSSPQLAAAEQLAPEGLTHLTPERQHHYAAINRSLEEVAASLAAAMADAEVRALIKEEVLKKFSGDYEALYSTLANRKLADGRSFRRAIAEGVSRHRSDGGLVSMSQTLRELDAFTASLPNLHVAVPVWAEEWDVSGQPPLVTFAPFGVDDLATERLEAFDAQGQVHWLDAKVEPLFPVVVVGLNERTDENGYLRHVTSQDQVEILLDNPSSFCNPTPATHQFGDREYLHAIKIEDDKEPWWKGDPEIFAAWGFRSGSGNLGRYNMAGVNDENVWYGIDGKLFNWHSNFGSFFLMSIWEEDGGGIKSFTVTIRGVTLKVEVEDNDDRLGYTSVDFQDPNCDDYDVGDAEFLMRFDSGSTIDI